MYTVKQSENKLEFISRLSLLVRIILLSFGFVPLLAPYELLIKPSWNGRFSVIILFLIIISIGAIFVSILFISAALLGKSQYFQFDGVNQVFIYRFKTAIHPFCEERYDFNLIEEIQIKVNEWESRADTYDISINIQHKGELKFGNFISRQEGEHYLGELEKMIKK